MLVKENGFIDVLQATDCATVLQTKSVSAASQTRDLSSPLHSRRSVRPHALFSLNRETFYVVLLIVAHQTVVFVSDDDTVHVQRLQIVVSEFTSVSEWQRIQASPKLQCLRIAVFSCVQVVRNRKLLLVTGFPLTITG